jgi:hypothetical protein
MQSHRATPNMSTAISLFERAWAKVAKGDPAECWLWTGSFGGKGGPMISANKGSISARRVIWMAANGETVPDNRHVVTTCGEQKCVNPAHLRLKPFMDHEARFWEFVKKADGDACWEWQSTFFANGYAAFGMNGKERHASRVAWEFTYGPIEGHVPGHPDLEVCVCHRCDNPKCVRPEHLFLGHDRDNMTDMHAKGRHRGGPNADGRAARINADRRARLEAGKRDPLLLSKPQKTAWLVGAGWTIDRKRGEPMWFNDPLGLTQRMRVEEAFELQLRRERSGVAPSVRVGEVER